MLPSWINQFQGSEWHGQAELWLDPAGNAVEMSECTLTIQSGCLTYTWAYAGETQTGSFTFDDDGATWTDSWHQSEAVHCEYRGDTWGLFTIEHAYAAPSSPDWSWRSKLSQSPDGPLVLQMTTIDPWGEEGRAGRMVCQRTNSDA